MSDKSAIQWTDATWNPTTGCTKISPGCAHCYIERTPAFRIPGRTFVHGHIPLQLHANRIEQPLHWKKPRRVFVNSLSDLFHEDVPDDFIDQVFAVMALAPQHTFQVLTKRSERMQQYVSHVRPDRLEEAAHGLSVLTWNDLRNYRWPLPNVWLGVSVENQHFADERIPLLLKTPAAVRFISAEPLLEHVNLDNGDTSWLTCTPYNQQRQGGDCCMTWLEHGDRHFHGIDWVIVGGESGPGARPFAVKWAWSLLKQCRAAGVAAFLKQLGGVPVVSACRQQHFDWRHIQRAEDKRFTAYSDGLWRIHLNDRKGGDMTEWAEHLRVRDFPSARESVTSPTTR